MSQKQVLCGVLAAMALVASSAEAIPLSLDVGPVLMSREGGEGVIARDAVTGATAIDMKDLNGKFDVGPEIAVTYRMGVWGGQVRGLSLDLDNSTGFVSPSGNNLLVMTNPVTSYGLGTGDTFSAGLSTSLNSFEANALYDASNGIEYFAGLRSITLEETMDLAGVFGPGAREDDVWKVKTI